MSEQERKLQYLAELDKRLLAALDAKDFNQANAFLKTRNIIKMEIDRENSGTTNLLVIVFTVLAALIIVGFFTALAVLGRPN